MDAEKSAVFDMFKLKQTNKNHDKKWSRIRDEVRKYSIEHGFFSFPFTLRDDGTLEAKRFLEVCTTMDCLFDTLFDDVYVCPKHLTIHECHASSRSCNIVEGQNGSVCCGFSRTDLSKENVIVSTVFSCDARVDVEGIDDRFQGNKYSYSHAAKTFNSQPLKSQVLYRKLTDMVRHVVNCICDQTKRDAYNQKVESRHLNSKHNILKNIPEGKQIDIEQLLVLELVSLCNMILKNKEERQHALFLLTNLTSFVYISLCKIVHGIFDKGRAILTPPPYCKVLHPMPKNDIVEKHFGLELKKFSKCMKIVQVIIKKKSFRKGLIVFDRR